MAIQTDWLYSFDDSSILNLLCVKVPAAFEHLFSRKFLCHPDQGKLFMLIQKLDAAKVRPHRFVPSQNLEMNARGHADRLVASAGNGKNPLPDTLRVEFMDQFLDFVSSLDNWKEIKKAFDINSARDLFVKNERNLEKSKRAGMNLNIPEDDDLRILAGLREFSHTGQKLIVSSDEHFWGYSDLMWSSWKIRVVKESECDTLI